ncbi:HEPN domain-containing protein [Bradyrhizobium australafricanum]|uniref:HEPN domain-containing protein n=1 Tax=Bradyrhizobium australafricanum TaxID=2821406 RepID=UPI001CE268FE|nr:HEPN domain-containing protein [Bradyrhizobium australafricanum]MCA6097625.1 hypothetical protein [Bradyrhizobium australafricanum]
MTILQERGRFWWHEQAVPAGQFAPEASVTGLITIDPNGRTDLELDGQLPGQGSPFDKVFIGHGTSVPGKYIQGVLTSTGQHVLLADIIHNGGGFHSHGPWRQNFIAFDALVGSEAFATALSPVIHSLKIDLEILAGWLELGSISFERDGQNVFARYERPKSATYELGDETLSVVFDLVGPFGPFEHFKRHELSLRERASLKFKSLLPKQLEEQQEIYCRIGDLFILLTGSELILDWPKVSLDGLSNEYSWYFWRENHATKPIKRDECWTRFPELQQDFGSIWRKWTALQEEVGAGAYLYLGTRRGKKLYSEHQFVNLIWGIEAFHRKRNADVPSEALAKKIARILARIDDPADNKWLRRRLRYAHEPSLGDRIASIIGNLPIGFDTASVKRFANECADKRNAVSHFGANKDDGSYSDFVGRLQQLSEALATLYHYLLLYEIGVSAQVLNGTLFEGRRSHAIKRNFHEVGLTRDANI